MPDSENLGNARKSEESKDLRVALILKEGQLDSLTKRIRDVLENAYVLKEEKKGYQKVLKTQALLDDEHVRNLFMEWHKATRDAAMVYTLLRKKLNFDD